MHLLSAFTLLSSALTLFGATGGDTFHWSGRVPTGQFIEIRGINGSIHAEPASGDDVDVFAYKPGSGYDPSRVEVKVMQHDGGVTICAVSSSVEGQAQDCTPGSAASEGRGDVEVEFTVRVPKGVRFVGRTVNGQVEAMALDSDTEAHTVNGNLLLNTAGTAQGETVNGSINARVGHITRGMTFSTVNGGITLDVPSCAEARIHANTLNGRILTNFPLAVKGTLPAGVRADGSLGGGGPELRLATVNGTIKLSRSHRDF